MNVSPALDDILTHGFRLVQACWPALWALCALGLAFMLLGHRFNVPGRVIIHRAIFFIMAAILLFSVAFMALAIYATSNDNSYVYGLLVFVGWMLVPMILSLTGLLLARFSRFPVQRRQTAS